MIKKITFSVISLFLFNLFGYNSFALNLDQDYNNYKQKITPKKLDNYIKEHLKNGMKIEEEDNLNQIESSDVWWLTSMKLKIVDYTKIEWLEKEKREAFINKLQKKFNNINIFGGRNLIAVNNNNEILWFINVDWNFKFFPAMLAWNGWNQKIEDANPLLKKIIEDSSIKENNKVKIIWDWTFRETKVLKFNKDSYWKLKKTYLSDVWNIGVRIQTKRLEFILAWEKIIIPVYWIFNIDNWEMEYIKNWKIVLNNKWKSEIPDLNTTWNNKTTTPKLEKCSSFVDKNFIKTLENKYNLKFQQDSNDKTKYWLIKDDNFNKVNQKEIVLDNNIDGNNNDNISNFKWSCSFQKIDIKTNWKETLTCNYLKNKTQSELTNILSKRTSEANKDWIYYFYNGIVDNDWNKYYLVKETDWNWKTVRIFNGCNGWIWVDNNVNSIWTDWSWKINSFINELKNQLSSTTNWDLKVWNQYDIIDYFDSKINKEYYIFVDNWNNFDKVKTLFFWNYPLIKWLSIFKNLEDLELYWSRYTTIIWNDIFKLKNLKTLFIGAKNVDLNNLKSTNLTQLENLTLHLNSYNGQFILPETVKYVNIDISKWTTSSPILAKSWWNYKNLTQFRLNINDGLINMSNLKEILENSSSNIKKMEIASYPESDLWYNDIVLGWKEIILNNKILSNLWNKITNLLLSNISLDYNDNWTIKKVTNLSNYLSNFTNLTSLILDWLNLDKLTVSWFSNLTKLFIYGYGNNNLTSLDLNNLQNLTSVSLNYLPNLTSFNIDLNTVWNDNTKWDISNVWTFN